MEPPRPRRHAPLRSEIPDTWTPPSPGACVGLYLATRTPPTGAHRSFRDGGRLFDALARGDLSLDEAVRVGGIAVARGGEPATAVTVLRGVGARERG